MEIEGENGETIIVYTADEVAAREEAARTTVSAEYTTKLTDAETEKARLEGILANQAGNFRRFNKLSEEQEAKLSTSEREKYEIQKQLSEANDNITALKTEQQQTKIDAVIASQCGNDPKLIEKTKAMYAKIDLPTTTPEEVAARVRAAFGAIAPSEPSVASFLASSAGNGAYQPPTPQNPGQQPSGRVSGLSGELGISI